MSTIAVFGGSFDPLTLAHEAIIRHALDDLNADKGILIPCSDEYIFAKKGAHPMFPADVRTRMLLAAFRDDARLTVDTCEVDAASPDGRSLLTMRELQKKHPFCRLIFVTGADKLATLPKWGGGAFLKEFDAAVYPREGVIPAIVPDVTLLPEIRETAGISSGKVKTALMNGCDISAMVSPIVYRIINQKDLHV